MSRGGWSAFERLRSWYELQATFPGPTQWQLLAFVRELDPGTEFPPAAGTTVFRMHSGGRGVTGSP